MSLSYEIDSRLKALAPVLDEYAVWYADVIKFIFYPEDYEGKECLTMPGSFSVWVAAERSGEFIEGASLEKLLGIYAELQEAVSNTGQAVMSRIGKKPPVEIFYAMTALYEQFMTHLRRVEVDCIEFNNGLDSLTGLRHRKAMERDLANEMERIERQGRPFSMALACVDNFPEMRSKMSDESYRKAIKSVSDLIRKCVRSFDDAYRSDEAEFIMVLKHSDLRGGSMAIERLRSLLQEEPIGVRFTNGELKQLTMSYCIAEPQPEESVETLLRNMRADLGKQDDSGDKALEYIEQSPLLRFVAESEKK